MVSSCAIPGNIMSIDLECASRGRVSLRVSITQINPCIFLSTWLNATPHMWLFVLGSSESAARCFVSTGRLAPSLLTWPLLRVTTDPTDRKRLAYLRGEKILRHPRRWHIIQIQASGFFFFFTFTSYKWMCGHTRRIINKSEQRTHQRQTIHTCHLCTLPHPFWNFVLTSNIVSPAAAAAAAAAAERAQTVPLCIKISTEANKSMQITACLRQPNGKGHAAEVTLVWDFVLLADYLSVVVQPSLHASF